MAHSHPHAHSPLAAQLLAHKNGIRALQISLVGLLATAALQSVIVYYSGSAALLADTLHNLIDALSALPLWVAFSFARRKPTARFTYGYTRWEDIAGLFILLLIFGTAGIIAFESYVKFTSRFVPQHLPWVIFGAIVGFLGNEAVAQLRMKVGRQINSAALIADGQHARADGWTSLGVLIGALGVYAGFPLLDSIVGFVFSIMILKIGWDSSLQIFFRLADAVDPQLTESLQQEAGNVEGVFSVLDIKARNVGHSLRVEVTIEVDGNLTVSEGHDIAIRVQHALQKKFPLLISPTIHVDPKGHQGEEHHFMKHHASKSQREV